MHDNVTVVREASQIPGVRTTTSTMPGDHWRIDVSLEALIYHGIVERTTEKYEHKQDQSDTEVE